MGRRQWKGAAGGSKDRLARLRRPRCVPRFGRAALGVGGVVSDSKDGLGAANRQGLVDPNEAVIIEPVWKKGCRVVDDRGSNHGVGSSVDPPSSNPAGQGRSIWRVGGAGLE